MTSPRREDMAQHEISKRFMAVFHEIVSDYEIVKGRANEDPGTTGDHVEGKWAEVLRDWLPATYHVVTKGRMLDLDGASSRQLDVIVLHPAYPRRLRNFKYYIPEGVAAAFECKTTLRRRDVGSFIEMCASVKRMRESSSRSPYDDLHRPIVVGLLAHSVDLGPRTRDGVIDRLWRVLEEEFGKHLDQPWLLPDVLCIADTITLTLNTTVYFGDAVKEVYKDDSYNLANFSDGAIETTYMQQLSDVDGGLEQGAVNIGALIAEVTQRLAWNDETLRDLAMFFCDRRIAGGGFGPTNLWTPDALSPEVWERLRRDGFVEGYWSKWDQYS
jgi:hypothetical protein